MSKFAALFPLLPTMLACALFAAPAQAARDRVFVASYGSDSNPCTFGSPCKTFQAAVNAVAPGGEVTAIDSAGFGPIVISKSVTITSPAGIEAGVVATGSQDTIDITAASTDTVVLRGLHLDGNGSSVYGIHFSGGRLEVIDCVVRNFTFMGISVVSIMPTSVLIANTIVTDSPTTEFVGIKFYTETSGAPITAVLDQVTVNNNASGIYADTANANAPIELLVSNSHIDNNATTGIAMYGVATANATAILKNVTLNQELYGIDLSNYSNVYLSQVTQTAAPGFTNTAGLLFENNTNAAYSDGTNHFMGPITGGGSLSSWTPQ